MKTTIKTTSLTKIIQVKTLKLQLTQQLTLTTMRIQIMEKMTVTMEKKKPKTQKIVKWEYGLNHLK